VDGKNTSMETWCNQLRETGGRGGAFSRALMEEERRKQTRLATLSASIGLPLYETHTYHLPGDRGRMDRRCAELEKAGWKLSVRLLDTRDGQLLLRDVNVAAKALAATVRDPHFERCTALVSPYKDPTTSGTVLVSSGDALLEMVNGPHYWLTKSPPEGVSILRCWYRFPSPSVQYSTDDPAERLQLFQSLRDVVRMTVGVSLRQLSEIRSSLYAEYHWRSDLGYRFLECSYSSVWTGGPL